MKQKWEVRYFVTDVASIPVYKAYSKTETYRQAAKPSWGTVEWYSAADGYKNPFIKAIILCSTTYFLFYVQIRVQFFFKKNQQDF